MLSRHSHNSPCKHIVSFRANADHQEAVLIQNANSNSYNDSFLSMISRKVFERFTYSSARLLQVGLYIVAN